MGTSSTTSTFARSDSVVTSRRDRPSPSDEDSFCVECGQPIGRRATDFAWKTSTHPWWAWVLIVFGAAFVATFGLGAWQADRERSAIQDTQQGLPATEIRLEGPSVQRAAPIGVVDRYDTAERQLSRSLVKVGFGLATATLGIPILPRSLAERPRPR